mmetsp:Transcript_53935/g.150009  ORF Transcript_53935/g.150009 Transcript_53935/m.150009 type:complete len:241 (-) Transcript_53935:244-966(-)
MVADMGKDGTKRTPARLWTVAGIYWVLAAAAGTRMGYFRLLKHAPLLPSSSSCFLGSLVLATVLTCGQQVLYYYNSNSLGRKFSIFSAAVFVVMNGVFETFLFWLFFDAGVALGAWLGGGRALRFSVGFLGFFIYSGLVHALMWEKVFPFHLTARFPGTRRISFKVAIVSLTFMSFSWFWLYFAFEDRWSFVLLHMLTDMVASYAIRFAPPWARNEEHTPLEASSSGKDGLVRVVGLRSP